MSAIVQWPNEILAGVAQEVEYIDDKIRIVAADMMESMVAANGIGLAAPQIGIPLRIIVGNVQGSRFALVNPEIVKHSGFFRSTEGCLSFDGKGTVDVMRAKRVKIKAFDLSGDEITFKAGGLLGACLQHEIDHLNGITLDHYGINDKDHP